MSEDRQRVTFGGLIAGSFRVLAAAPLVWLAAVPTVLAVLAARNLSQLWAASGTALASWVLTLAVEAVAAAAGAGLAAVALRAWMRPDRGWRLDGGAVAFVAAAAAALLLPAVGGTLMARALVMRLMPLSPSMSFTEMAVIATSAGIALRLAALIATGLCMLWPIAGLLGEAPISPGRSAQLMARAVWPWLGLIALTFVLAGVVASLAAYLLTSVHVAVATGAVIAQTVLETVILLVALAGAAAIYRQRAPRRDEVAQVFD